jgi:hypothetical protein
MFAQNKTLLSAFFPKFGQKAVSTVKVRLKERMGQSKWHWPFSLPGPFSAAR